MVAPVVVFAIGNPSRGDDAIGPLLAERLSQHLAQRDPAAEQAVEVIVDQQLVVEHVLDLVGRQRVLFVDAAAQAAAPVSLTALKPLPAPVVTSHRVSPADLLGLFQAHMQAAPPPAELLAVVGDGFELGAPLSAEGLERLEAAWARLLAWVGGQLGS